MAADADARYRKCADHEIYQCAQQRRLQQQPIPPRGNAEFIPIVAHSDYDAGPDKNVECGARAIERTAEDRSYRPMAEARRNEPAPDAYYRSDSH